MVAPRKTKKVFCTVVKVPSTDERSIGPDKRFSTRPSDLLPWADPYIARLVRRLQAEVRSDRQTLRADLERLVGPVENPTTVADLELPAQPPPPTVTKGVVPRIERPGRMMSLALEPVIEDDTPFYVKLRAEGDQSLYTTGTGKLYVGMHLDPLYRVHWNNEAGPVRFRVNAPTGVTVTPDSGVGPTPDEPADADPREFLLDVDGALGDELTLDVFYFACDDALTFCIPVNQSYALRLERDVGHAWSLPMTPEGTLMPGFNARHAEEALEAQAKPEDTD